jgi:uncharacterized protein
MSFATLFFDSRKDPSSANSLLTQNRIQAIDVLRGIAVLGGYFTAVWLFGGFTQNKQNGLLNGGKGWDYQLFYAVNLLLEGKMMALIAIVFGASMLLYLFKGKQKLQLYNQEFFIRRQLWLLAFGLINALVFLWSGDLLFHLAIMGVLLFPFIRLSSRGLLVAAILTTLIYCGKNYWKYADDKKVYNKYLVVIAAEKKISRDSAIKAKKNIVKANIKDSARKQFADTLTKKQKEEKQAWEGLVKNMKYDAKKDDAEKKALRDTSYTANWNQLLPGTQNKEAQWLYTAGIWDLGSMIFFGMALFRFGFFESSFATRKHVLLAVAGLAIGIFLGWLRLHHQQLSLHDYERYIKRFPIPYHFFYPLEILSMALAYASLVLLLIRLRFLPALWKGLAIAGQMALTNYLVQCIAASIFFMGYGMGYFGKLQQWQLYFFAAEVILLSTVFSVFWLRHYYYGPAEWLWRCLVYKKWFKNRKNFTAPEPLIAVS